MVVCEPLIAKSLREMGLREQSALLQPRPISLTIIFSAVARQCVFVGPRTNISTVSREIIAIALQDSYLARRGYTAKLAVNDHLEK